MLLHQNVMPKWGRQLLYYWMPYVTYTFLLLSAAFVGYLGNDLFSKRMTLFAGMLGIASVFLGRHIFLCFRAPTVRERTEARFSLLIATLSYAVFIALLEVFLPPLPHQYSNIQRALQLQVERANTHWGYTFREIQVRLSYNELGWADEEQDYVSSAREKIVFIGDSFLEVSSEQPLASRTQALLNRSRANIDILNFSKDNTGPEHYRHRFYEFTPDVQPDRLFLFLYEANDMYAGYTYRPYAHQPFSVTKNALEHKNSLHLPKEVLHRLDDLQKQEAVFQSKAEFLTALDGFELSETQKNLTYLTVYGYFTEINHTYSVFPKFFAALNRFPEKMIDYVREEWFHTLPAQRRNAAELYRRYTQIFNRQQPERLEALAKFLSQEYLRVENYQPCLELLKQQSEEFRAYLTTQSDMMFYLFQAVEQALYGTAISKKMPADDTTIDQTTDEYVKLFDEIQNICEANDIELTIVLIPEASYADQDFYQFWLPMIDFHQFFSEQHSLYLSLKEKLNTHMPVIDLGEFSHQLRNSYWKFDGHWNEKGNQKISAILARSILENRS